MLTGGVAGVASMADTSGWDLLEAATGAIGPVSDLGLVLSAPSVAAQAAG